ncbi:hypothetical protein SIL08_18860 [Scandinavium sp. V105_16]|uniref:Lipoprotein n=1 Tax=Scandinavium lactucae TaxID=3095028 RepID=A0AAJ2VZC5_9ENTR|nr:MULTISPECIES: hypothetical protein [unclassified Scandinavium]MDX6022340.1 hypothetical protein [Scandinavium sp. V105_16]MDX6033818.1 hypothetical protein [Scandinavium sp. V105_12]MDX6042332.1 hypothetical protein [Scandinavium sp. V105_6]MDX6052333.1 hypothetical protein [Scandinavium sp. V105_1]
MKKPFICAFIALAFLSGCTHSPAHRIAECEKKGGSEADCNAAEWAYEKAHPLPQYDPTQYDNAAALQAAYNASAAKVKTTTE